MSRQAGARTHYRTAPPLRSAEQLQADAAALDDYAHRMAYASAVIHRELHDGRDTTDAVAAALIIEQPPGVDPVVALANMLAAQIPDDGRAIDERLAWTEQLVPGAAGRRAS